MSIVSSLLLPILILSLPVTATAGDSLPKLLLISFDGLGWNFLSKLPLPSFQTFMDQGVHVRWVENVFPTLTRPNHMTIVSGLYSESHGIVGNSFYDDTLKDVMPVPGELKEEDSQWVDVGAEPVWVTNSKAGQGRRSGTVYWPCADARIKGTMPDEIRRGEWSVNETTVNGTARIDVALDWLTGKTDSKQPANFVAVYTWEPDDASHKWGPDSQQVLEALQSRDDIVKHLLSEMKARNLEDELNVIITADHGQLPVYPEATINLDLMIDPSWYTAYPPVRNVAMSNIWPKEGFYQKIVEGLKGHMNLHLATSSDSGELLKMHYLTSPRIANIVVYAESGWILVDNHTTPDKKGEHGWDPRFSPQMWPFFMAKGPAFKKGVHDAEPFHMVDIYPLMCRILGLNPAPNNGTLSRAAHILASHVDTQASGHEGSVNYAWVVIGLLVALLGAVAAVLVLRYVRNSKNVTASYKRTFARAGSTDDLVDEGMVVISDEEL